MKKTYFLLLTLCLYLACTPTTTNKTVAKTNNATEMTPLNPDTSLTEEIVILDNDLVAHLKRTAGVTVLGTDANPCYSIRGRKPLFVVNGNQVGTDFQVAADYVRHQEIKSVSVLHYFEAKGLYTLRGNNGVILIETE